ncbi:Pre-mRNA-splicing factor cwf16 [Vanrija albida]|uniref:Splicing factor YJU2 n=1 Tax=Vanrija albida TaxID=181172 RepID=A0ABR3Q982_9TREE
MSERKVLNKYFPPDFDPSKIKRRKGGVKDPQMQVRLMAPFSMRCKRCGEYVYKGKKFNARKETAVGEEYLGVKVFRFYIKCPTCSSEITFKTDPKQGDFIVEHGATRNFENWAENDPGNKAGYLPDAADDDAYDSEGNAREDQAARDAMADLEASQEASRRGMEVMEELADLRQRNARLETSRVGDDPEALLDALHREKANREEEARRAAEDAEDDELVARFFTKVPTKSVAEVEEEEAAPAVTIKRSQAAAAGEPTVAALLAAKGKVAEPAKAPAPANAAQVKRKREGMQKLLGIKKKAKA